MVKVHYTRRYQRSVKVLGGTNNDVLNKFTLSNNNLYIAGCSNSKDGSISVKENNGKDYFGKIILINEDLKFEVIK